MLFKPIRLCVFIVFDVVAVAVAVAHNLSVFVFVRLACRLLLCAYRLCAENVFARMVRDFLKIFNQKH